MHNYQTQSIPPDEAIVLFTHERAAEDNRLKSLEHVRISSWNPRSTMQWDRDMAKARAADLKRWCESWWSERGYRLLWRNDADEYQVPSADIVPL